MLFKVSPHIHHLAACIDFFTGLLLIVL